MLTCERCGEGFERPGTRGPRPRFCSIKCRGKWQYSQPHIREYQRLYAQRPDRRLVRRLAGRARYATEEYRKWARERWRRLFRDRFAGTPIPEPYYGHPWLDMARNAVNGGRDIDPAFRDFGYNDEVGEALLALLEGRDMGEAVKEFRRREFIPRHLTMWLGDWKDGDEDRHKEDRVMPSAPSAEEEVVTAETVMTLFQSGRYDKGANRRRFGNNKGQQQPSRRRMKDKSLRSHRRAV